VYQLEVDTIVNRNHRRLPWSGKGRSGGARHESGAGRAEPTYEGLVETARESLVNLRGRNRLESAAVFPAAIRDLLQTSLELRDRYEQGEISEHGLHRGRHLASASQ
jgi:hypothetical protein